MYRLESCGANVCFKDVGRGGPPLVLIHDLGRDHSSLAPQIEHFRRDHRVVAVDLSRRAGSEEAERETSIPSLAGDVAWLIYELGLYAPVVVGHGLGGMVAIELGARHPDLPSAIMALHPVGPWQLEASPGGHVEEWDSGAALAACSVPVLYVVAREGVGPFIRLNNPDHVNALIDAFLARHGKDEKAGRNPVGRLELQHKPSPRVRNLQRLL